VDSKRTKLFYLAAIASKMQSDINVSCSNVYIDADDLPIFSI
jgi:hypothetical protein